MRFIKNYPLSLVSLGIIFIIFFGFSPYFPKLNSANEYSRLYLALSIVYDGDFEISDEIKEFGNILDKAKKDKRYYSDKPPGISLIASIPIFVLKKFGKSPDLYFDLKVARIFASVLPSIIVFLLLFLFLVKTHQLSDKVLAFSLFSFGVGSLMFTYSILLYEVIMVSFLLFLLFLITIKKEAISYHLSLIAGFISSLCITTQYQSAILLLPITLALFIRFVKERGFFKLVLFVVGSLPLSLFLIYYNYSCFGSIFSTGYSTLDSQFFASIHKRGFMGISLPHLKPFLGSFFSLSKGISFYSPITTIGIIALLWYRRNPALPLRGYILIFVITVLWILFVSSLIYWSGGWTVSQRHFTPVLPFIMIPFSYLLEKRVWARVICGGFALSSVIITFLATVTFPYIPEYFSNPLWQIVIPLARRGYFVRFLEITPQQYTLLVFFIILSYWTLLFYLLLKPILSGFIKIISYVMTIIIPLVHISVSWYYYWKEPQPHLEKKLQFFIQQHKEKEEFYYKRERLSPSHLKN